MSEMKRPANMSRIRSFFERWERLETQRRELSDDLKELFSEAKGEGFNSKALRTAFAEKFRVENEPSTKAEKRQMDEADADLYLAALAGPSHACEEATYAEQKGRGFVAGLTAEQRSAALAYDGDDAHGEITEHEQPETGAAFNNGEDHDADSGQHVGRENREQQHAAPVQSADGRGEGADDGDQGQGAGASGPDRRVGAVERELDCQNEDGRSRDVGGEAHHAITPSDGGAIVAVKAQSRLANADSVEPPPSVTNPQPSTLSGADKPEAVRPPAVSGALSDDDVPAFLKRDHASKPADKPNCLKLKDGHCRIGFATSALCADCNAARSKARAGA